jgi:flagellar biosynthesis GTPase FlhF
MRQILRLLALLSAVAWTVNVMTVTVGEQERVRRHLVPTQTGLRHSQSTQQTEEESARQLRSSDTNKLVENGNQEETSTRSQSILHESEQQNQEDKEDKSEHQHQKEDNEEESKQQHQEEAEEIEKLEDQMEKEKSEDGQEQVQDSAPSSDDEIKKELEDEERKVREVGGYGALLGVVAMIFTAHQMSDNPDGIFAAMCRLVITICGLVIGILLSPCRRCIGPVRVSHTYGHLPHLDYGFRDPAMELS